MVGRDQIYHNALSIFDHLVKLKIKIPDFRKLQNTMKELCDLDAIIMFG